MFHSRMVDTELLTETPSVIEYTWHRHPVFSEIPSDSDSTHADWPAKCFKLPVQTVSFKQVCAGWGKIFPEQQDERFLLKCLKSSRDICREAMYGIVRGSTRSSGEFGDSQAMYEIVRRGMRSSGEVWDCQVMYWVLKHKIVRQAWDHEAMYGIVERSVRLSSNGWLHQAIYGILRRCMG